MQGVHERLAALLPDRTSLLGRAAADLRLDRVEFADPAQRLFRQWRAGGLVDFVKAPPAMRPASVRVSPGKGEGCSRKPFIVIQRVRHPPGKGAARQPEASSCMGVGNGVREA